MDNNILLALKKIETGRKLIEEGESLLRAIADNKASLQKRKHTFKTKVWDVAEKGKKYTADMCKAFCNHWTQANGGGKKMSWEKQQTFQIANRLTTWSNNEKKFNGKARARNPVLGGHNQSLEDMDYSK